MLLRKKRGPGVNSDWLFIIRWVNLINVTATRVPTEKPHRHVKTGGLLIDELTPLSHFRWDADLSVFCTVANRLEPRSGPK